jgi:phosphotransferase system IIB component
MKNNVGPKYSGRGAIIRKLKINISKENTEITRLALYYKHTGKVNADLPTGNGKINSWMAVNGKYRVM